MRRLSFCADEDKKRMGFTGGLFAFLQVAENGL